MTTPDPVIPKDIFKQLSRKLISGYSRKWDNALLKKMVPRSRSITQNQFARLMFQLAETPTKFQDPDTLEMAMEVIDLERVYSGAERRQEEEKKKKKEDPEYVEWGYIECVIQELLDWFKNDFFVWVNSPKCSLCGSETSGIGGGQPNTEEKEGGAGRVELYKCNKCTNIERFPRYNNLKTLLKSRRGRCGEWANCFCLLATAVGAKTRWVWNQEDHVWTEIYSYSHKRWVHCDSCENAFDKPTLYEKGWGKQMSYAIAFGPEGAFDVTYKYVEKGGSKALPRNKIADVELEWVLLQITKTKRFQLGLSDDELITLECEDVFDRSSYYTPSRSTDSNSKTQTVGPRESGSKEWVESRGEDGKSKDSEK